LGLAKLFAGFDERESFPNGAVFKVKLKENLNICNPMDINTMRELDLKSVLQKMIDENYIDKTNGLKFHIVGIGFKGFDIDSEEEFEILDSKDSVYYYLWRIKNGSWKIIECEPIIEQIKSKNYDGFFVVERSNKNIAIFDENSIDYFEKMEFNEK
jgi:hypothetical protein